jgi:pimeloyl-ACP methyl ester carboxylesterase
MRGVTSTTVRALCSGLAAFALLACAHPELAGAADALAMAPCAIEGLARAARCGVLEVAESGSIAGRKPAARVLPIHVMVVPAAAAQARPDPIALLMGGPGEDAISAAAYFVELLGPLLEDRDLLLVDQRGTGKSNALRCQLYSPDDPAVSLQQLFPRAAVRLCAQQLAARADLTQYGYARFADDLERVRRALGYAALNLHAGSYGTRAAQVYLRAYPRSVRTAYLGSVVPFDLAIPLPNARNTDLALERVFAACAADPACHAAFPELRAEFREILARLDAGTVRITLPGQAEPAPLARGRVIEWLRSKLYRPKDSVILPWLIHRAHRDDWSGIVDGILTDARGLDSALSVGLLLSITCSEDLALVREADVRRETQGTALGDFRVRQQLEACREWPTYAVPASYRRPVRSRVPVLFASGDTDVATPLWYTERVAPGFSNRHEVIQAGLGHTEWSECTLQAYQRFLDAGGVRGVVRSVCPAPTPLPFKIR